MRSSKPRSRSKSNRSRSVGNIVNRVFDSSGPEGKVRGTPQQIIEKYNQLARDAQLSNDRVAAENFQQHAEHYTRLLGEAQREQEARRDQQEAQQSAPTRGRNREDGSEPGAAPQPETRSEKPEPRIEKSASPASPEASDAADVIDFSDRAEDSTLVDTPEEKPAPKAVRSRRSPGAPKSMAKKGSDAGDEASETAPAQSEPSAAE